MTWRAAVVVYALILSACSQLTSTGNPVIMSTSTLPAPGNYVRGQSDIPARKYVFLEYRDDVTFGGCDGGLLDFPGYGFDGKDLGGYSGGKSDVRMKRDLPVYGYVGVAVYQHGEGGGAYSYLVAIQSLPLSIDSPAFDNAFESLGFISDKPTLTPYSLLDDGTAILSIGDTDTRLEPGDAWKFERKQKPRADCLVENTLILTNYGLLDEEHVHVYPEYED